MLKGQDQRKSRRMTTRVEEREMDLSRERREG